MKSLKNQNNNKINKQTNKQAQKNPQKHPPFFFFFFSKLLYKRLTIHISGGQKGGVTCTASLKGKGQSWELGACALTCTL